MMPTGIRIKVLKYTFQYKFTNIVQYIFLLYIHLYIKTVLLQNFRDVSQEFLFKHHRTYSYERNPLASLYKYFSKMMQNLYDLNETL